jgi:chemotaxis protein MotC
MRRAARLCIAGMALAVVAWPARAQDSTPLQLYQLVRSLQLVQDRIAGGDHATLPMQAKLLEIIDAGIRAAKPQDLGKPRNFRALLVYGMSGGNPATLRVSGARLDLDAQDRALMDGVLDYLDGRPAAAIKAFEPIDPLALPSDLGAFVALVKGSLLGAEQPEQALALLDLARLLSPGTLVEEAALRRSVGIAAAAGDAKRFLLGSTQYVERFLHSPYASQFADSFVSAIVAFGDTIDRGRLADITAMMDTERERVIYLRIARSAAIDGLVELSTFAAAKAKQGRLATGSGDQRGLLYSSLSTVTSANVPDLQEALKKIDRDRLSASDRTLLDAAQAIAREMIAPPPPAPAGKASPDPAPVGRTPTLPESTSVADDSGLPPVEGAMPDDRDENQEVPPSSPASPPLARAAESSDEPAAVRPAPDATDITIFETRRKLDMIDQLLGASPL